MPGRAGVAFSAVSCACDSRNSRPMPQPTALGSRSARSAWPRSCARGRARRLSPPGPRGAPPAGGRHRGLSWKAPSPARTLPAAARASLLACPSACAQGSSHARPPAARESARCQAASTRGIARRPPHARAPRAARLQRSRGRRMRGGQRRAVHQRGDGGGLRVQQRPVLRLLALAGVDDVRARHVGAVRQVARACAPQRGPAQPRSAAPGCSCSAGGPEAVAKSAMRGLPCT